jgi:hypothetical protein
LQPHTDAATTTTRTSSLDSIDQSFDDDNEGAGNQGQNGASARHAQPNVIYFNRTEVVPVVNELAGISLEEAEAMNPPHRRLLQAIDARMPASASNVNSTSNSTVTPPAPRPSSSPAAPTAFVPHPSTALALFGGSAFFAHGQFAFVAPLQSSRFAQGSTSLSGADAAGSKNRIVVGRTACLSFEEVPKSFAVVATTAASNTNHSVANSSSTEVTPSSSIAPDHLISASSFVNSGLVRANRGSRLNFTSIPTFRSAGLLEVEQGALVQLELSDASPAPGAAAMTGNEIDGVDARRGPALDEEAKARVKDAMALLAGGEFDNNVESLPVDEGTGDQFKPSDFATSASEPSASLASLQAALAAGSDGASSSLVNRPASGGVGLHMRAGSMVVRGGRLHWSGGFIARRDSHLFLRKGARWTIDVEPTVTGAWGVPPIDPSFPVLSAGSSAPFTNPSSVSFLHAGGVELSMDGSLLLRSGHLVLESNVLMLEGHGQIVAETAQASILMDTRRINRAIQAAQQAAAEAQGGGNGDEPFDSAGAVFVDEPSVLVENEAYDASDPDADPMYSLVSSAPNATNKPPSSPSEAAPAATVPSLRENLVAPCVTTLNCQSLQLRSGARLVLAPFTTLHLLPRTRVWSSSTLLEGGTLLLDSNVLFEGRSLVANVSSHDAAAFDSSGAPLSLSVVHVGPSATVRMMDAEEPLPQPPGAAWSPTSEEELLAATQDALVQVSSSLCVLAQGNLSGSGTVDCGGMERHMLVDAVMLYPTSRSPSPFTPAVPPTPASPPPTGNSSVVPEAPTLKFASGLVMSERTVLVADVLGSVRFATRSPAHCCNLPVF